MQTYHGFVRICIICLHDRVVRQNAVRSVRMAQLCCAHLRGPFCDYYHQTTHAAGFWRNASVAACANRLPRNDVRNTPRRTVAQYVAAIRFPFRRSDQRTLYRTAQHNYTINFRWRPNSSEIYIRTHINGEYRTRSRAHEYINNSVRAAACCGRINHTGDKTV